jgi:hypothetical protein
MSRWASTVLHETWHRDNYDRNLDKETDEPMPGDYEDVRNLTDAPVSEALDRAINEHMHRFCILCGERILVGSRADKHACECHIYYRKGTPVRQARLCDPRVGVAQT